MCFKKLILEGESETQEIVSNKYANMWLNLVKHQIFN